MHASAFSTAELCDRFGSQVQVCRAPLESYGGRRVAWGTIDCMRCVEDAALLRTLLAQPGKGRILVVDGGGSTRAAILGDRMARLAMDQGWTGVIVHGAVRDVDTLRTLDLAVLALGHVPVRGGKTGLGEHGVDLRFGEASFVPGAFVCLDGDGVVVLAEPPAALRS